MDRRDRRGVHMHLGHKESMVFLGADVCSDFGLRENRAAYSSRCLRLIGRTADWFSANDGSIPSGIIVTKKAAFRQLLKVGSHQFEFPFERILKDLGTVQAALISHVE